MSLGESTRTEFRRREKNTIFSCNYHESSENFRILEKKKIVESEAKLTFSIAGIDQNDLTDFV